MWSRFVGQWEWFQLLTKRKETVKSKIILGNGVDHTLKIRNISDSLCDHILHMLDEHQKFGKMVVRVFWGISEVALALCRYFTKLAFSPGSRSSKRYTCFVGHCLHGIYESWLLYCPKTRPGHSQLQWPLGEPSGLATLARVDPDPTTARL